MEAKWSVYAKRADFKAIGAKFNIDQVVARVIRNRDIIEEEDISRYLHGTIDDLREPLQMADMELGVLLMQKAIGEKKHIRVIADYDVDGVMSGYVLTDGLRQLEADVSVRIPHRMRDGYGMNVRLIEEAYVDGVDVIITCDNGIAAADAIMLAKNYGMTVIVTDHHTVPYSLDEAGNHVDILVPADAVIDPHRDDCDYPYKGLCGAGVAYKFLEALYRRVQSEQGLAERYLPFVALATVCDIMDLTDENRIIVKYGLERIKKVNNIGMKALLRANNLMDCELSAYHFGFVLGPCINAVGRLGDAQDALALFLCDNEEEAAARSQEMVAQNEARKQMTEDGVAEALQLVEAHYRQDKVLVLYMPSLHESLAGIVAGKIKERYYRPTIVLTDAKTMEGEVPLVKGSGRSIAGYMLYEALHECEDILIRFGGHALAAGVTLAQADIHKFRELLNINQTLTEDDLTPSVMIDVPMPMYYISKKLLADLKRLEPFGKGNEKPLFGQTGVRVKSASIFGSNGQYVRICFMDENGYTMEGIEFCGKEFLDNIKLWFTEEECDKMLKSMPNDICLDVVYYPEINSYRGHETLQIKPCMYRKSERKHV